MLREVSHVSTLSAFDFDTIINSQIGDAKKHAQTACTKVLCMPKSLHKSIARAAKEAAPERGTHEKSFPTCPILVTESKHHREPKHHTRRVVMLLLWHS